MQALCLATLGLPFLTEDLLRGCRVVEWNPTRPYVCPKSASKMSQSSSGEVAFLPANKPNLRARASDVHWLALLGNRNTDCARFVERLRVRLFCCFGVDASRVLRATLARMTAWILCHCLGPYL